MNGNDNESWIPKDEKTWNDWTVDSPAITQSSAMKILITKNTRNFLADTGVFEMLFRGMFEIVSRHIFQL